MNKTVLKLKQSLTEHNQHLLSQFEQQFPIEDLVQQRCQQIDQVLKQVWNNTGLKKQNIALVAVGGYGRATLHPQSDIDLLFLVAEAPNKAQFSALSDILTLMWDIGLEVGHSVRTVEESVKLGREDVTIATSLLEARLLCGESKLFYQLQQAINQDDFWPEHEFYQAKYQEQKDRHDKINAFDLEPNLKSCPGG